MGSVADIPHMSHIDHRQMKNYCADLNNQPAQHRDIVLLTDLNRTLQACVTREDIYQAASQWAALLFPRLKGSLSAIEPATRTLHTAATWGNTAVVASHHLDMCQLPQSQCCTADNSIRAIYTCPHQSQDGKSSLCIPIQAHGHIQGVVHLFFLPEDNEQMGQYTVALAEALASQLALAFMNLFWREQLMSQATRDPLTDLFHRGYLEEALHGVSQHAIRFQQPVGLIMLDIDHFKDINDTYGHQAGDVVLQTLVACVRSHLREGDIACRYGGDEFTLLLPGASLNETHSLAEALQQSLHDLSPIRYHGSVLPPVTLSFGIASFPEHGTSGAEVLRAADYALYRAKATGRDQVRVATTPLDTLEFVSNNV